jgi:hypothetical protein
MQQFVEKYPEHAKATGLVLPTKTTAATPPAPRRTTPVVRPKTPAAGTTLTQDQLSAAQRGNIASSKSFGWRTNPGVYPEGPGSALLAEDIAFIQRKFSIGGSPGVMAKSIIDRIQNQQLSGLGAVQADSVSTLDVVSRLLSGVVFVDTSNINWWYVGGAGLAVAAALAAVALTSDKA